MPSLFHLTKFTVNVFTIKEVLYNRDLDYHLFSSILMLALVSWVLSAEAFWSV